METLCFTPTSSPQHLKSHHTSSSTSVPSLIRPLVFKDYNNPKKNINLRNQQYCKAILTNPAEVTSFKPSPLPSPFETTPLHEPSQDNSHELRKVLPETLEYESGFLGSVPKKFAGDDGNGIPQTMMSYLTRILTSKVYDVAIESPLDYASKLSNKLGVHLWLKREDLQPVFSFKLRGAYNMMAKLSSEQLDRGVICSSAGNHAQGVALSARKLGCTAVIVMPITTPEIKWKTVESLGATVVLVGESYDEAQSYALQRAKDEGLIFVHPFDHPDVIAGQGTVGMEILRQIQGPLHAIFVPVGGGGLIAGIASYVKSIRPEVKIIGVELSDANAMALSLHHGERVVLERVGGFADGMAVKKVGEETFRLCRELMDGVVLVNRDAICASIKDMFEQKRSILEPAGAAAIAGAEAYCKYYGLKGENVVAITSGANMNFDRLRLVSQLADVGRRREGFLATFVPEKCGSFKLVCELVGPMNIIEISYRFDDKKQEGLILYSVSFHTISELEGMLDRMKLAQLQTINLTDKELIKDHMEFLVGGRSNVENEILCRLFFPERPGALMKFLNAFSPLWNITLFHYSGQGETGANALVGFQVASSEIDKFKGLADTLGYDYAFETTNETLQLLLH
ncbi:putative threonine ammonia-lyase [Rosa chinensis]|uniref:Threonine dehydratase n=1 Tax=Rosa chinensis TaxID=74649 RepID=A0A2P6QGI3_ROSCH|nr:threonine dehydratase biosynthetic, chloroplastic [Rosa chinensis]PRQ33284.1 putative threonine ammonia-lyase [Rosa chinensis]